MSMKEIKSPIVPADLDCGSSTGWKDLDQAPCNVGKFVRKKEA